LIANSFFIHETEKLQRREPVIPGLLSQKLLNIMTVVLCSHKRDGLRMSAVDCDGINPYQRDKLEWCCQRLISSVGEGGKRGVVYSLRRRVLIKRLRLVSLLGVCQWLVDLLVVVFNQNGDLLLNQVWLLLDDRDDFVHRLRYRYGDVLHDGHDVWFGNPNRHWDGVRFRDRNGLGNVDDVWFWYLNWYRDGVGFRDWEGLRHRHWLQDRVGSVDVLDNWDNHVFGDKLRNRQRLEDRIWLRDEDLLVNWIGFRDGNVFRHVFDDDLHRLGVFYVSIFISSITARCKYSGDGTQKYQ